MTSPLVGEDKRATVLLMTLNLWKRFPNKNFIWHFPWSHLHTIWT